MTIDGLRTRKSIQDAVHGWAQSIAGAPKALERTITAVAVRDEIVQRLATEVRRRDIRVCRRPATQGRRSPAPLDPSRVDPFAVTIPELAARSEYIAECDTCQGLGSCACEICRGTGAAPCSSCNGSGREYSDHSKRMINCKACRGKATQGCSACLRSGKTSCQACATTGSQVVWLTFDQTSRWVVTFSHETPIVTAHQQLLEGRFLAEADLEAFTVLGVTSESGPMPPDRYRDSSELLRHTLATIDGRIERIANQQIVQFGAVRRDVSYEMAGRLGTIVLSGNALVGAVTRAAVAPIRQRRNLWIGSAAGVALASWLLAGHFKGESAYFTVVNSRLTLLWLVTLAFAIPAIGAGIRAVRPKFKFGFFSPTEKVSGGCAAVFGILMIATGAFGQPSIRGAEKALAAQDTKHAREIINGMKERGTLGPEGLDAEDSVAIAEAVTLPVEERVTRLDAVAARGGKHATEARASARQVRLEALRTALANRDGATVVALTDHWFKGVWSSDDEVRALRASAHDVAFASCKDEPCRLQAAQLAQRALGSEERKQRTEDARSKLMLSLVTTEPAVKDKLQRLKYLRELETIAAQTISIGDADAELAQRATAARDWAHRERAKVPLVGSSLAIVEELLGQAAQTAGKIASVSLGQTVAYLSLGEDKTCRGVYATGATAFSRAFDSGTWSADHLLSQAVGQTTKVKAPTPEGAVTSRWYEVSTQVVARFNAGKLVELRIGDATP